MKPITINSYIQIEGFNLLISGMDGYIDMMNAESCFYLCFNKTGKISWKQLEHPILVTDFIKRLRYRFSVEENTCSAETLAFLHIIAGQKALYIH